MTDREAGGRRPRGRPGAAQDRGGGPRRGAAAPLPPPETVTIEDVPFRELLERDPGLADARRHYAGRSAEERRMAADLEYHAGLADEWLAALLEPPLPDPWRAPVRALAIDPTFAPALLTVGTLEYELGRRAEALALLGALTELPAETEDLAVIIGKAGDYLVDRADLEGAEALWEAASAAFPEVADHRADLADVRRARETGAAAAAGDE